MLGLLFLPLTVLVWVAMIREHHALKARKLSGREMRVLLASRWQLRLAGAAVVIGVLLAYLPILGATRTTRVGVATIGGIVLCALAVVVYLKAKWRAEQL